MTFKSYRIRIFLTCWVIFSLHFATDFVREHYLVLSIADNFSFRLDGYEDMHPDIFVTENYGAHHGANPGASMLAAIPYVVFKPVVDAIDALVQKKRAARGGKLTAVYNDPRPDRVFFYKQVRERGLDIKFGLTGFITQVFFMAPVSALSAVVIFSVFVWLGVPAKTSTWLSILYVVGTPMLFRTGFLNQNVLVGIFTLFSFVLVWKPYAENRLGIRSRYALAGFFTGLGLLNDYSGVISLGLIGIYALVKQAEAHGFTKGLRDSLWYGYGAIPPILLLWLYQYRSFGNPFYPGQHYMPPVEFSEIGYQGFGFPEWEILQMLWFDPRFGLFVSGPVLILGLFIVFFQRSGKNILPKRETMTILIIFLAVSVFFSAVQYSRIQYYTGIRYLMAIVPILYILAGAVLLRAPKFISYIVVLFSVSVSWSMAMVRSQAGIFDSVLSVFLEGFQLPWLNTLSRMATQYVPGLKDGRVSALPFMVLAGAMIYGIWVINAPARGVLDEGKEK